MLCVRAVHAGEPAMNRVSRKHDIGALIMRAWVRGIEIEVTLEEFDQLIERYGTDAGSPSVSPKPPDNSGGGGGGARRGGGGGVADGVILKTLVEAGSGGVEVNRLGDLLGRKGKAMRGAAKAWANRVGLATNADHDPFEECRVGSRRGIRIKPSLMELAKALNSGRRPGADQGREQG